MTRTLYVFDFDGVLFDTARECLEVAFQAVRSLPPRWSFADRWRSESIPPDALVQEFLQHRYLVGPPWQYALLLECLGEGTLPPTTAGFLELAARRRDELMFFEDAYFKQRAVITRDRSRWLALAAPYEESTRVFRTLYAQGRAVILSTRDSRSIRALVAHSYGIELTRADILPRPGPREKWNQLLDVAAKRSLDPGRIFFVDDYVQHALPARRRGISAYLATWGYLGPEDIQEAAAQGLPCLRQSELEGAIVDHERRWG